MHGLLIHVYRGAGRTEGVVVIPAPPYPATLTATAVAVMLFIMAIETVSGPLAVVGTVVVLATTPIIYWEGVRRDAMLGRVNGLGRQTEDIT